MADLVLAVVAGIKLTIFTILLVYTYLATLPFKKKGVQWLLLVAGSSILIAIAELLHFTGDYGDEYVLWSWIMTIDNLSLLSDVLFAITGVGILLFLQHILANVKDYK